ncbi:unnamed protein product [Caenorhabditis nigoni]
MGQRKIKKPITQSIPTREEEPVDGPPEPAEPVMVLDDDANNEPKEEPILTVMPLVQVFGNLNILRQNQPEAQEAQQNGAQQQNLTEVLVVDLRNGSIDDMVDVIMRWSQGNREGFIRHEVVEHEGALVPVERLEEIKNNQTAAAQSDRPEPPPTA